MLRSFALTVATSAATLASCASAGTTPPVSPTTAPSSFADHSAQRKVLIVMSAAHELELKDGKRYSTGTYLDETAVPLRAILSAGYTPVFASPGGIAPSVDAQA